MSRWEYKVVPAPTKGVKARGAKGPEGRFAYALEALMNEMAADGWAYLRAETLPSVERAGLTSSTTEWRNVLVFRRAVVTPLDDFEPELLPAPVGAAAEPEAPAEAAAADDQPAPGKGATEMQPDNGVEATSEVSGMTASLKLLAAQRLSLVKRTERKDTGAEDPAEPQDGDSKAPAKDA
ncbi:MAG: DUF4177 domain-containing protein [Pseudomonadota bacterium]